MERLTIVIGGAKMLATGKSNSSRPFPDELRNPSVRFGDILVERLPNAIDKSSGNGHLSHRREETMTAGFLLLDASLQPIYASEEALAILSYPEVPSRNKDFGNSLQSRIRSQRVAEVLVSGWNFRV